MNTAERPMGVFDSGLGGLSVLRAIRELMSQEDLIYFGDQIHVPYGARPLEQIQAFSEAITQFLRSLGVKLIVVACNTASAAALNRLRRLFPDMGFVGMEPAVKPAAEQTHSRRVGILATPATFQGALYASVVERFANGVQLFQDTCPGLVAQIEAGDLNGRKTRQILEAALRPMLEKGIDTVVLGCTHYPFVIPLIRDIVGDGVRVIDPAPAVARQVRRVLEAGGLVRNASGTGSVRFITSGSPAMMKPMLSTLFGEDGDVEAAVWREDRRIELFRQ